MEKAILFTDGGKYGQAGYYWSRRVARTLRRCPKCRSLRRPPPAGQARIWFYRDWEPSESLNLSNIDVNGVYIGSVENGSTFYRDVPAGQYHLAPQSYGHDFNQDKDIELGADQQVYVKIVSLRLGNWGRVAKNLTSIATHFMLG